MNMKVRKNVTFKMARNFDTIVPVKFLEKLGFKDAAPMESSFGCISFADCEGVGYTVTYKTTDDECGIVTVSDVVIIRDRVFDCPPINQHDLFEFLRELDKNPDVDTKKETLYRIYDFMNSYK